MKRKSEFEGREIPDLINMNFEQPDLIPHDSNNKNSRYLSDFYNERPIGWGGQGHVYAATNRIDGITYAIKKVKLCQNKEENCKIL